MEGMEVAAATKTAASASRGDGQLHQQMALQLAQLQPPLQCAQLPLHAQLTLPLQTLLARRPLAAAVLAGNILSRRSTNQLKTHVNTIIA